MKLYNDIYVHPPDYVFSILSAIKDVEEISDIKKLSKDLEEREQQGGFVIGGFGDGSHEVRRSKEHTCCCFSNERTYFMAF